MKIILLVLLCVTAIVLAKKAPPYNLKEGPKHFEDFIDAHNKIYDSEEEKAMRYEIFLKNVEHINQLNAKNNHTEFGVNKFSDLTLQEFLTIVTCLKLPSEYLQNCKAAVPRTVNKYKDLGIPTQFDWRDKNVVTRVKNQGRCGSCWAISTIGNVESISAIKTGKLVELSQQQLVDCDKKDYGCQGGRMDTALEYLISNGSMSSASYSYEAKRKQCRYDSAKVAVKVKDCIVTKGTEEFIAEQLVAIGPLSIAIDATPLMQYKGGVINGDDCRLYQSPNHAVLLVGYGVDNNMPYWVVKNSWGVNIGEKGYFRMQRGCSFSRPLPQIISIESQPSLSGQMISIESQRATRSTALCVIWGFSACGSPYKRLLVDDDDDISKVGITRFSDLTLQEFLTKQTCVKAPSHYHGGCRPVTEDLDYFDWATRIDFDMVPTDIDWRDKNVVTRVKDQGQCGSCWAFSTVGNVESIHAIKTNQLTELAEQQLVDCDTAEQGCNGGWPNSALQYFMSKGAMTSESYPYTAAGGTCKYDASAVTVRVADCVTVTGGEDAIAEQLVKIGPLSITVDATSLQNYRGGLISGEPCQSGSIDHAVLLVGYGTDSSSGQQFWLVKNSWAESWGEQGYFRMQKGVNCLGITQFSDLTLQEFLTKQTCVKASSNYYGDCRPVTEDLDYYDGPTRINLDIVRLPTDIDWRDKNVVTSVKNQGGCGSCWAFSTVGNVESMNAIKTGQLTDLSEQQLVDCDTQNNGCKSGIPAVALQYFMSKGAMTSESYPYTVADGTCKYDANSVAVRVADCVSVTGGEDAIAEQLAQMGPLSIAIDSASIHHYNGAIIHGQSCQSGPINHAVLLVGYGTDSASGLKYWIVKNSWGEIWGENGYFRMEKGVNCLSMTSQPPVYAVIQ
nr:uncharacterized protein LOC117997184 [Maniola hyperantus]